MVECKIIHLNYPDTTILHTIFPERKMIYVNIFKAEISYLKYQMRPNKRGINRLKFVY